ncbi:MAG: hypothetical protein LQ342_003868 [Letrouitia transgressa]|nr:MAG: hypothetical protein LQ342_003868 [Letrouitia transgressa]
MWLFVACVDDDYKEGRQDLREAEEDVGCDRLEFREGASRKQIRNRLFQIVKDDTAILHSFHYPTERVEENHIRGFDSDVGSAADGDTDIRGFEGWGVIRAFTCHADDFITSLQFDAGFLVGIIACKDELVVFAELVPLGGVEDDEFGAAD